MNAADKDDLIIHVSDNNDQINNVIDNNKTENNEQINNEETQCWLTMHQNLNHHHKYLSSLNSNKNYFISKQMNKLIVMIEEQLRQYCNHDIEVDHIDTSPDDCKQIFYCKHCLLTFTDRSI